MPPKPDDKGKNDDKSIFQEFDEVRAAAGKVRDKLEAYEDPADIPAELHAEADKIFAEAAKLRHQIDKDRSIKAMGFVADQRGEFTEAQQWLIANDYVSADPPGDRPPSTEAQLVQLVRDVNAGKQSGGRVKSNLEPAFQRNQLIRAGVTGHDLIQAAMRGRSMRYDEKGNVVQAAISRASGLVADEFSTTFYDFAEYMGGLRNAGSFVTQHETGNDMEFFKTATHNASTGATAEGADAPETEDTYTSYEISFSEYTALAYLSKIVIQDSAPAGLMDIINDGLMRVLVRKSETAYNTVFTAYDGTSAATKAKSYDRTTKATAASAAADPKITAANILDGLYGLDETYLSSTAVNWLMRAMTYRHIIGDIVYSTDNPQRVYEPNPVAGAPRVIESVPVIFDAFLPVIAKAKANGPSQVAAAVGDFRDAFHIADATTMDIDVSTEYRFGKRQVTVLGAHRTGSAIRDPMAARLIISNGAI